jgi:hypothetical protein
LKQTQVLLAFIYLQDGQARKHGLEVCLQNMLLSQAAVAVEAGAAEVAQAVIEVLLLVNQVEQTH